jgi:hypothetical protein
MNIDNNVRSKEATTKKGKKEKESLLPQSVSNQALISK